MSLKYDLFEGVPFEWHNGSRLHPSIYHMRGLKLLLELSETLKGTEKCFIQSFLQPVIQAMIGNIEVLTLGKVP